MIYKKWLLSIFYSLFRIAVGLMIHPYQTMQSLFKEPVFIFMTILPTFLLGFLTMFWKIIFVPFVGLFFRCSNSGFFLCEFLTIFSNFVTFFCIYWQVILLYLFIKFHFVFDDYEQKNEQQKDQVILVNNQDEIIGELDKYQAHENPAKLHRAVSVWLFRKINGKKEFLFQKRSTKKIVGAGYWANTICGNVRPNESYEDCAQRRLKEEIGFEIDAKNLIKKIKFQYYAYCNEKYSEREMDQVFFVNLDEVDKNNDVNFIINPDEVSQICWIPIEILKNAIKSFEKNNGRYFTAEETVKNELQQIKKRNKPVPFSYDGISGVIASWTVIMIKKIFE